MRRTIIATALVLGCGDDTSSDGGELASSTSVGSTSTGTTGASTTTSGATTSASTSTGSNSTDVAESSGTSGPGSTGDETGTPPVGTLEIFWIDTEGGAATLLATPDGPLVLVDTGFPGDRDADRIAAVVQDELGATSIDLCIITHYHLDHVGGVPDLMGRVPIDAFWDHGDSVEAGGGQGQDLWEDYLAVADGKRTVVEPGRIEEIGGVELTVVSSAMQVIDAALPGGGAPNPACDGASNMGPVTNENGNSVGFVVRFGSFEMLDLGDLTWSYEDELACPLGQLGPIDLYQTTHHGLSISGATQLVHGIDPLVVVMNNGANKGGDAQTFDRIFAAPSMPDLWQQHRALGNDDAHNAPDDFIANLEDGDGDEGFAIHARIGGDGMVTVTNRRNDNSRAYRAR